jgi:hypothetical protein
MSEPPAASPHLTTTTNKVTLSFSLQRLETGKCHLIRAVTLFASHRVAGGASSFISSRRFSITHTSELVE